jgi:nucleotide-binding universal stress UspA family protein
LQLTLGFLENDMSAIVLLVALAQPLNAGILLTHIYNPKTDNAPVYENWIGGFLADIVNKVTYARIDYKIVNERVIEDGLDRLIETENIDMMAMVHYQHNFLQRFFGKNHTQKMAGHITIPLWFFPPFLTVSVKRRMSGI